MTIIESVLFISPIYGLDKKEWRSISPRPNHIFLSKGSWKRILVGTGSKDHSKRLYYGLALQENILIEFLVVTDIRKMTYSMLEVLTFLRSKRGEWQIAASSILEKLILMLEPTTYLLGKQHLPLHQNLAPFITNSQGNKKFFLESKN